MFPRTVGAPRSRHMATAALRLLLLTGCRLREILNLRWEEFDRERGMLLLPDSKTGRKPVILSGAAIAVLEGIPRTGDYVIAGLRPERARRDLKRPWEAIRHRAALGPVRLHDLRHTFAATGAGSNLGLPVIGKSPGHRRAGRQAATRTSRRIRLKPQRTRSPPNSLPRWGSQQLLRRTAAKSLRPILIGGGSEFTGRSKPSVACKLAGSEERCRDLRRPPSKVASHFEKDAPIR